MILGAAASLLGFGAAEAGAQTAGTTVRPSGALIEPDSYDIAPDGRRLTARQVLDRAEAVDEVRRVRRDAPRAYARVYLAGDDWQFSLFAPPASGSLDRKELAQVLVDDRSGRVTEAWTGVQVEWPMARGYPGAFGRSINAPWIWIGLCVLFVLPFLRRPLRLLHLDLAVLLAFSVSYAFFGAANLDVSIPSAYPLLAYLLVRMLVAARRRAAPPKLLVGPGFLLLAIVFLAGFRVALNVVDGNVIDVGYSGVIGADRLAAGGPLYGAFPLDDPRGDTYGPVAYAAYVPFELIWPWRGTWDDLPAAHAASLAFDLGSALLLFLIGRRLRGREHGLLLAYLWMAFPFTLLVANSNSNDALVSLLVLAALLVVARPAARGATLALAGLTKFAPLALAPLFATYPADGRRERGRRRESARGRDLDGPGDRDGPGNRDRRRSGKMAAAAITLAAFALVTALILAPVDLEVFWRRTLGFQQDRGSPFSVWGFYALPSALQTGAQVLAVVLAVGVAFVPRRGDLATVAALAAAVLIAVQLTVDHWFYLYLVWFAPLVWIALLTPEPGAAPARSHPPAPAASSG